MDCCGEPIRPGANELSMRNSKMNVFRRSQRGVTLLEMIVVLVIIALIAGLVGVRLVSQVDRSKSVAAKAQIQMLKNAVESVRADIGRLPTTEEGLKLLVEAPADMTNWFGPYIENDVPTDPWGAPYIYEPDPNSRTYFLYSLGDDGAPGGRGAGQDIGNLPPSLKTQLPDG